MSSFMAIVACWSSQYFNEMSIDEVASNLFPMYLTSPDCELVLKAWS